MLDILGLKCDKERIIHTFTHIWTIIGIIPYLTSVKIRLKDETNYKSHSLQLDPKIEYI